MLPTIAVSTVKLMRMISIKAKIYFANTLLNMRCLPAMVSCD